MQTSLVITCEHATAQIPKEYAFLFDKDKAVLNTHRAIDFGAKEMALNFNKNLSCTFFQMATASRLLIDCNRSLSNKTCFSEWTDGLGTQEKETIIQTYYQPFRTAVLNAIQQEIAKKRRILHLSIHSFTPVFAGVERTTDIGLLYDSKRSSERQFALKWRKILREFSPTYRIKMNSPYQGTSDGHTTALRKLFPDALYTGLELEVNQAILMDEKQKLVCIERVTESLKTLL